MATVELRNICQHFNAKNPSKLNAIITPLMGASRAMKTMDAAGTAGGHNGSFVMEDLNLTIPDGKTLVILGPSGCGKSTLLRIAGGLIVPDSGEVRYDGVEMHNVPPGKRQIGMVFQNYALYPHLNVRKNILSYFLFRKPSPELDREASEKYQRTSELLGVEIEHLLDKMPTHLSGGEKQRVAIGRCITRDPKLFLLDEPFSNLDQKLRDKYRSQLKKLLRHFKLTTVYVTHDQQEALVLADILAVMNTGTIEQVGTPKEIYEKPVSQFVAEFLNFDSDTPAINLLDGSLLSEQFQSFIVGVRSENIELYSGDEDENVLPAEITEIHHVPVKRSTILSATIGPHELSFKTPLNDSLKPGARVRLLLQPYHLFYKESGLRRRGGREKHGMLE